MIAALVDPNLTTVEIGDLSHVPAPEIIGNFVPAVIINPLEVENEFADNKQNPKIVNSIYSFTLYFLKMVDPTDHNLEDSLEEAENIAQLFFDNPVLKRYNESGEPIEQFFTIANGGQVLSSLVKRVKYSTQVTSFYEALNIPLEVIEIDFKVFFRTFNV